LETFYTKFVSFVYVIYFCRMIPELENILERISCLYRKYGIKSVTMDDVARELGISKKTLYLHFSDKDDLVLHVLNYEGKKRTEDFKKIFDRKLNAIEELLEVNRYMNHMMRDHSAVVDYDLKKYYPEHYAKTQEMRRAKMYESVLNNMRKGKQEGLFRSDLNEEIITKLHVSRIMCMTENPYLSTAELSSPEFFSEVIIYHIRGIANENGIKILEANLVKEIYKI
jgi:TetR/AcrR family transcriptional regulator, cholesterol catabolism regulator